MVTSNIRLSTNGAYLVPRGHTVIGRTIKRSRQGREQRDRQLKVLMRHLFSQLDHADDLELHIKARTGDNLNSDRHTGGHSKGHGLTVKDGLVIDSNVPHGARIAAKAIHVTNARHLQRVRVNDLTTDLRRAVRTVRTRQVGHVHLGFNDAGGNALQRRRARLIHLRHFNGAGLVTFALRHNVELTNNGLRVLPVTVLVHVLRLPQLSRQRATAIDPRRRLHLLRQGDTVPNGLRPQLNANVIAPVVPNLVQDVNVRRLAISGLLNVILHLV